jgi:hypothetical protein
VFLLSGFRFFGLSCLQLQFNAVSRSVSQWLGFFPGNLRAILGHVAHPPVYPNR